MSTSTVFFLIIGAILVVAVFRLVRNLRLREKYAALWLGTGLVVVLLMIFPGVLDHLAGWVGVATPVNLLFLIAIILLLGVCLHLSLEISRLEDETRVLAEEAAIQRSLLDRYLDPDAAPISEPERDADAAEAEAAEAEAAGGVGRARGATDHSDPTDTPEQP